MRRYFPMALLAVAAFGMDAEAAVRVYRPDDPSQVVLQLGSSSGETQLAQLRAVQGLEIACHADQQIARDLVAIV